MAGTPVSYNSHDLQTSSIITSTITHDDSPKTNANSYELAHANRSVIPYINRPSKTIRQTGWITGDSISAVDALVDTFKGYFTVKDKNLDVGYNGTTRRYIATAIAKVSRESGLGYAEFDITYICTYPFGQNTTATTAIDTTGNTSASYAPTYTFLGTAPVQSPTITVTYSAMTGNTEAVTVYVGNQATSQAIQVSRIWASTDVLVIDTDNKTVTVNGSPFEFSGAFPEFEPGSSTFQYMDGFTTRTFDFEVSYYVRYM